MSVEVEFRRIKERTRVYFYVVNGMPVNLTQGDLVAEHVCPDGTHILLRDNGNTIEMNPGFLSMEKMFTKGINELQPKNNVIKMAVDNTASAPSAQNEGGSGAHNDDETKYLTFFPSGCC